MDWISARQSAGGVKHVDRCARGWRKGRLVALARYPQVEHGMAAIAWIVTLTAIGVLGGYGLSRLATTRTESLD